MPHKENRNNPQNTKNQNAQNAQNRAKTTGAEDKKKNEAQNRAGRQDQF